MLVQLAAFPRLSIGRLCALAVVAAVNSHRQKAQARVRQQPRAHHRRATARRVQPDDNWQALLFTCGRSGTRHCGDVDQTIAGARGRVGSDAVGLDFEAVADDGCDGAVCVLFRRRCRR